MSLFAVPFTSATHQQQPKLYPQQQFAALGALKNLAVLDANKAELARRGVMAAVRALQLLFV